MGAIAAAVSKQRENAVAAVIEMLKELKHRGAESISLASQEAIIESQSFHELENRRIVSNVAAGQNHSSTLEKKKVQPDSLKKNGGQLLFEGYLFPPNQNVDGSFAFARVLSDRIIVARDLFGTAPLYYGENSAFCCVASERKALWKIGIKEAHSFPPENSASITEKGFSFKPSANVLIRPARQRKISLEKAASKLEKLLLESTRKRVTNVDEAAVAFSGGLDSTVLAALAKKCIPKVRLITVGLKNQSELQMAEEAAEVLELPLNTRTYRISDVEHDLKKTLWLIEEPDLMKAGVAIPFFWTSETASKLGCPILLAGQGADELFGGYHRYLGIFKREGADAVQQSLFDDLMRSYEVNFQRDEPVCAYHGVDLRLPYVAHKVALLALSLPLNFKIDSPTDSLRKRILRQVARNLGLSESLACRPKKAVQYATGVDKALRMLAHEEGLTPQDYIKQVFEEIYYPERKAKA